MPNEKRTERVPIRLTTTELEAVHANARAAGRTTARYVREAALGAKLRARRTATADELIRELRRIGNNVNQLAQLAHAHGDSLAVERLTTTLEEVLHAVRRLG